MYFKKLIVKNSNGVIGMALPAQAKRSSNTGPRFFSLFESKNAGT
jgi:hypothetical protein